MELEINLQSKQRCSITERQEKHAQRVAARAGVPTGEPLPHLTPAQLNEYSNLLHSSSGLDHQDARRLFKVVTGRYKRGDEVEQTRIARNVLCAIEGFRRISQRPPALQEVTVFDSQRR